MSKLEIGDMVRVHYRKDRFGQVGKLIYRQPYNASHEIFDNYVFFDDGFVVPFSTHWLEKVETKTKAERIKAVMDSAMADIQDILDEEQDND